MISNTYSISFNLESLCRFIDQELKLFGKVEHKVTLLKNKLGAINLYIEGSQSRSIAEEFVKQIRKAAYEAEDLIDKYIIDAKKLARRKKEWKFITYYLGGHRQTVGSVSHRITHLDKEIDEIFNNMKNIATGFDANANATTSPPVDVKEEDAVGFGIGNELRTKIVNQLTGGDSQLNVISIVGMGGSGKTMLANMLCKDQRVKDHFDCCIRVNSEGKATELLLEEIIRNLKEQEKVYQQLEAKLKNLPVFSESNRELHDRVTALLKEMPKMTADEMNKSASELFKRMEEMAAIEASDHPIEVPEEQEMQVSGDRTKMLSECLKDKKYLIVVNDVRETQVWAAFPDNKNGSRILITSRQKGVRPNERSPIHHIKKLDETDSWELVRKMVFGTGACPRHLESDGEKVAEICDGLPLALVIMGEILRERLRNHENWHLHLSDGRTRWRDKIARSYEHLSRNFKHLKLCFFYLGVFPRNYEIPVKELIQFWIAEGFIPQDYNKSPEKIAEEYLNQLMNSCLIEPTSRGLDGRAKTCRLHNVLLDLCLFESKIEDFLEVRTDSIANLLFNNMPRRLSVHCSPELFHNSLLSDNCNPSSARSFLWFGTQTYLMDEPRWETLCQTIPLVRVLYLGNVQLQSFPRGIHRLIYLKYLKLKGDAVQVLPDSISNLRYLVTLDLRGSAVNCLPEGVWKLHNLRYIFSSEPTKLPLPPKKSPKTLPSLQVLSRLVLDQHTVLLMPRFPLVTKLGLFRNSITKPMLQNVFEKMPCLKYLERLKIKIPLTEHLVFNSPLSNLTLLTKISLVESNINSADFLVLGRLPELRYLKVIEGSSNGNALECASDSFAKLDVFQMTRFPIPRLILSAGAMRSLRRLIIKGCEDLRAIPEIGHLTELKQVWVHSPFNLEFEATLDEMKRRLECEIQIDPPPEMQIYNGGN